MMVRRAACPFPARCYCLAWGLPVLWPGARDNRGLNSFVAQRVSSQGCPTRRDDNRRVGAHHFLGSVSFPKHIPAVSISQISRNDLRPSLVDPRVVIWFLGGRGNAECLSAQNGPTQPAHFPSGVLYESPPPDLLGMCWHGPLCHVHQLLVSISR